jgi:dethiobiotin synthetase
VRKPRNRIIFVTGTDTGVGKTMFTALLLEHLRGAGHRALAMKPFCSGGRADLELLQALQPGVLRDEIANPHFFRDPVAPAAAWEQRRKPIRFSDALAGIRAVQKRCDLLLVEGSGGLLVPLAKDFMVSDLITGLRCVVIVVARNQLGTINHTLLTVAHLKRLRVRPRAIILMDQEKPDHSARTNRKLLANLLPGIPVLEVPCLGSRAAGPATVRRGAKRLKKLLARMVKLLENE